MHRTGSGKALLQHRAAVWLLCAMSLCITSGAAQAGEQDDRYVESLIQWISVQNNMRFVRNGSEYSASDAADFMRQKLRRSCGPVDSAEEFIERCASKSSMSGEAYMVRYTDGSTISSHDLLRKKLYEMKKRDATAGK